MLPSNFIPVNNEDVETDKNAKHKEFMKDKFVYPRVDPAPSDIIDTRTDDEKLASIICTCSQVLTKAELDVLNNGHTKF